MFSNTSVQPLPDIFIGKELISQRVRSYLQTKHPLLSEALSTNGIPRQDTKSIWYSKEHVETWLHEMNLLNADGMRVYFGAYGNEEGRPPGQLCLLMVLTREGADGQSHQNIILENEPGFEERRELSESKSRGNGLTNETGRRKEYNYGAPCPPVCPDDDPEFP